MNAKSAIFFIVIAAFFLRISGIAFGLPSIFHQDEPIVVNHAVAYGSGDLNPHFFKIPPLLSYLLFLGYGFWYGFLSIFFGLSKDGFLAGYLKDPTVFYLIGRVLFGAVLGTGSVYLLYRMGRRLAGEATGLLAAGFLALCFIHVRDSHYIYVDIPMIFFILLAVHCAMNYSAKGSLKSLRFSAVALGVATAFKYIAAPFLLPILLTLLSRPGFSFEKKLRGSEALRAGLIVLVVYAALNPFGFVDFRFFAGEIFHQAGVEAPMPFWHHLRYSLFEGFGVWATLGGLAGALVLSAEKKAWAWLGFCPFFYYGVITLFSQPYERYAMPIVPFLCLTLAYLLNRLAECFRPLGSRRWFCVAGFLIFSTPTLLKSVELDRMLAKEDTRTLAKRWILENIEARTTVLVDHPFFSPRLEQTDEQLSEKIKKIPPADPQARLKTKKIRMLSRAHADPKSYTLYYLEERNSAEKPFLTWTPTLRPASEEVLDKKIRFWVHYRESAARPSPPSWLGPRASLVKAFSPYKNPAKIYSEDPWANAALPFLSRELQSRDRPGPFLEIYEIK
jgi:hypothetical protein